MTFGAHLGFHIIGQPAARSPCGCTVAGLSAVTMKMCTVFDKKERET